MFRRLKEIPKWVYVVIVLIVIIVFVGGYFFFRHFMSTDGLFLKKDLTCAFREKIVVSDFIASLDGELLNDYQIDTNEIGVKTIEIKYRNCYGFTVKVYVNIEILDVTSPTVVVSNPYTVEVGNEIDFEEVVFCADDYDDDISCDIVGEYNLSQVGNYELKVVARDKSNNETQQEFTLRVVSRSYQNESDNGSNKKDYTKFLDVYQKYKNEETMIGLDLSKWQGEVDFAKIKDQGVSFVMLKIGGQTEIDGEYIVDPRFYENMEKALANDIEVGVYFYSYARSVKEARKQVKWIVQSLKDYDITLPIAFDWENWNRYTKFHISFHTLNQVADAFLEEVEQYGYEGLLYSSKYYLENIWYQENYDVWLAYYTKDNDYEGKYQMWQLCSDGKIEGIDGDVDIDILYR